MSPLAANLKTRFGEHWQQVWEGLLGIASASGFAGMIEQVLEDNWATWSDFGRRRAGDVMTALASLDAQGGATPHEAAEWIERLEISQSPGVAAVQVMTIHKAKGLGFDVVIVPEVPNDSVPASQHFDVAEGDGWITETPPKWARDLIPEMRDAEATWATSKRYEAFCMLYVALTRSKRGLYVLLEPPSDKQEVDKPSLANWLARSISSDGQPAVVYQSGTPDWVEAIPCSVRTKETTVLPALAAGVPRRERTTPSSLKAEAGAMPADSAGGMGFGIEVHAVFEGIGWIDESPPQVLSGEAGRLVADLLKLSHLRDLFELKGRSIELYREQAVDAILDGKWLSGVIDRLHLHRDAAGVVNRVEVIDFKTDACAEIGELVKKYSGQMGAYQKVMGMAYPEAEIHCLLLSTACRAWIEL
jgi:ATP-dependent exoDNAse (exonuclease V) beta subunit